MKPIKGEGGGGERDETGPVPMGGRGYISRVGGGHPLRGGVYLSTKERSIKNVY